jgi:hypothetical protein
MPIRTVRVVALAVSVVAVSVVATSVVVGGTAAALVAAPAQAELAPVPSVGVQLPVQDFRAIELDEDRGRLYLAQGVGAGFPLVVTNLDGRLSDQVESVTDVSDLVLSDDGNTLYVAQGFSRIAALDAESLTIKATYPAPDGACVFNVEPAGDKVVGGYFDCGSGSGGLLVWSAPDTAPIAFTRGPDYEPVIDASPGAPGLVVAGDTHISPVTTYLIDVNGDSPRIVAQRGDTGGILEDYAVSPDGTEVVESVGSPYEHRSYRLPDLSDGTVYPSGVYPVDAAWSGDGSTVAVGRSQTDSIDADVILYPKDSTTATYAVDFRDGDVLWPGTVLVNRDGTRAWAVSYNDVYQDTQLLHSFGPAHAPNPPVTQIAVTASTGSGKGKQTANITVTWKSPMTVPPLSGNQYFWWITASSNGGPEKEFWRGEMNASGEYSLAYSLLPNGTTTFTVRFHDFEGWYPDGYATAIVTR